MLGERAALLYTKEVDLVNIVAWLGWCAWTGDTSISDDPYLSTPPFQGGVDRYEKVSPGPCQAGLEIRKIPSDFGGERVLLILRGIIAVQLYVAVIVSLKQSAAMIGGTP